MAIVYISVCSVLVVVFVRHTVCERIYVPVCVVFDCVLVLSRTVVNGGDEIFPSLALYDWPHYQLCGRGAGDRECVSKNNGGE